MNVILVSDAYPPEIRAISIMVKELAEELTARGHYVTVVTCWPRYNLAEEERHLILSNLSFENNIRIIRVKTPPHKKINFFIRGISELIIPFFLWWRIKYIVTEKVDAVIVYSPPLPLVYAGYMVKKKYNAHFLLNIQDIFPQNAIDLGIMRNHLLINFFEYLENKAYRSADKLTSHTESSKKFLIEKKNIPSEKMQIIPNWIDVDRYAKVQRSNIFRKKYGIEYKFIFLFAGIIGPSQGLDLIIRAARDIQDITAICFLFVGDGSEKERLRKMVVDFGLSNVIFKDFVSVDDYPHLLKDADVGLVCLSSMNKTPVVPGKILGFMAAALPVFALLNRESDGHNLIKRANCGYTVDSDAPMETIKKTILNIYREKENLPSLGMNGFRYAETHYSKKLCIDSLVRLVLQL
jgi:glycosyltransferase involved in cell wall biosynthesis